MTAKEAVESLMAKDPQNETLRMFKKSGLLREILYSDNQSKQNNPGTGGEGGKRVRSIAKPDSTNSEIRKPRKEDPVPVAIAKHDISEEGAVISSSSSIGGTSTEQDDAFLDGLMEDLSGKLSQKYGGKKPWKKKTVGEQKDNAYDAKPRKLSPKQYNSDSDNNTYGYAGSSKAWDERVSSSLRKPERKPSSSDYNSWADDIGTDDFDR